MAHAHTHQPRETAPMHDSTDAWHDHTHDEKPQSAHGEVEAAGQVIWIGLALSLGVVACVLIVWGFYVGYASRALAKAEVADPMTTARHAVPALDYRYDKEDQLALMAAGGMKKLAPVEEGKPPREVSIRRLEDAKRDVVEQYKRAGSK